MDLFEYAASASAENRTLADRMRPRTLDEFIGQEHLLAPGKPLRRAIETDRIGSMLLYGPPGCGKTSLAHIIANRTKAEFVRLNAVDASVKDVRSVIDRARENLAMYGRRTILFLDEVHRFNTAQQDALLSAVERGDIVLIGATTENPFHHVNGALLSRVTLYKMERLEKRHVLTALKRALEDRERGLGALKLEVDEEALDVLATASGGDIRRALNALELAAATSPHITRDVACEAIREPNPKADKSTQYDVLSAFHKSVRGSSDAALFWFLYGVERLGMDPRVFLRRLMAAASEDIGLADPQAMVQAATAAAVYDRIGWPEAKYAAAQAILYAVRAPKSNEVALAIERQYEAISRRPSVEVPLHLRDTHYAGARRLGHVGYKYPHDYPGHFVEQQYEPD